MQTVCVCVYIYVYNICTYVLYAAFYFIQKYSIKILKITASEEVL